MTVLVAQNLKDKIILTADRAIFRGYLKTHNENKIIQINDMTFAGAGMNEAAMCMHLGLTPKEAILKTVEMNVWTANGCQEVIINKQQ